MQKMFASENKLLNVQYIKDKETNNAEVRADSCVATVYSSNCNAIKYACNSIVVLGKRCTYWFMHMLLRTHLPDKFALSSPIILSIYAHCIIDNR